MSTVLAVPGVRGPGLGWLPPVLHQRTTWLTVWRFVWAGPLIGTLPYIWLIVSIPFGYAIGALPAAVAGLLFAVWYHGPGRVPTWPWRAAVGALAGVGGSLVVGLGTLLPGTGLTGFHVALVAAHGVPAALVLGLLQRPPMQRAGTPVARRVAPAFPG